MNACQPGSGDTVAPIIQARLDRDGANAAIEIDGCSLSVRYAEEDHGHIKSAVLLKFGARATGEPADRGDGECCETSQTIVTGGEALASGAHT